MENIHRYLKYGFEKIFTKMLITDKSNIPIKKRMNLIESLLTEEELKELPKLVASAYIESLNKVRREYDYYKR